MANEIVVDERGKAPAVETDFANIVLRTLAYSDVFGFPLTVEEISRYSLGRSIDFANVLQTLHRLDNQIVNDGEFYALRGRQAIFTLRRERAFYAKALWTDASRYGRLIGRLPFVRMVAVTGALASDNVEQGSDLDFLIVTGRGWLWLCRAAILAVNRVAKLFGLEAELCPNYLITEDFLSLPDTDLFTAQELTRMIPISGLSVYNEMRAANTWSAQFLPNAANAPRHITGADRPPSVLKNAAEAILNWLPLGWLEHWEMTRKIVKFSHQDMNAETRFSAGFCKGHFDGHKQQTMKAFQTRLDTLGLDPV